MSEQRTTIVPLAPARLGWADLGGFLVGRRTAILRVVNCPQGLLFGGLLVATVALAREYDSISLWHQPLSLAAPFVASVILAAVIYLGLRFWMGVSGWKMASSAAGQPFRQFLTGYWWTAPLAWLYAVPIEVMTDELLAVRFNLAALTIVSLWRVLLFSRVVSVIHGIPYWISLVWILLPCMALAFFGLIQRLFNLVTVMGGIQLTPSEEIISNYISAVIYILTIGAIPVLILAVVGSVYCVKALNKTPTSDPAADLPAVAGWEPALLAAPLAVTLLLCGGMWHFQPQRQRAYRVDRWLASGDVQRAVNYMQAGTAADFPTAWTPPPHRPFYQEGPTLAALVPALEQADPAAWVGQRLLHNASDRLGRECRWAVSGRYSWETPQAADLEPIERCLDLARLIERRLPAGRERDRIGLVVQKLENQRQQAAAASEDGDAATTDAATTDAAAVADDVDGSGGDANADMPLEDADTANGDSGFSD